MTWRRIFGLERRADATQLAVRGIEAAAAGRALDPSRLAVCSACASVYARAFESARIDGVVTGWLPLAVREVVLRGEFVGELRLVGDQFDVIPASAWDVIGAGASEESWRFRADFATPDSSIVKTLQRNEVVHLKWASSAIEPWRGHSPWHRSIDAAALSALTEAARAEASAPSGRLLSVPAGGAAAVSSQLQSALAGLKGGTLAVPTGRDGHVLSSSRIGPEPPASLQGLRASLERSVAASALIPEELLGAGRASAASREAYRRWFHAALLPLARRVESELARALERPVVIDLHDLGAGDTQGRSRALASLIKSGATFASAAEAVGLESVREAQVDSIGG